MGKPAARVGDMHLCPKIEPGTGMHHEGGKIDGPGCATVLIGGEPAAVVGDTCTCVGEPDKITGGSSGVFIGGKPAAREGDLCAHGGEVTGGFGRVLIGERGGGSFSFESLVKDNERLILDAVRDCIALLERKLNSIQCNDPKAIDDFKVWFGCVDNTRIQFVTNRIERSLEICKSLTIDDFAIINDDFVRSKTIAHANFWDEFHVVYLGDLFWKLNDSGDLSMADILVHEISHFWDVGNTIDFDYGSEQCMYLSDNHKTRAFYNAENFMYFIKA